MLSPTASRFRLAGAPIAPAVCAIVVALAALVPTLAAAHWHATAVVRVAADGPLATRARAADPGFALVDPQVQYSGQLPYAVALDPLALSTTGRAAAGSAFAYAQPAYGWLAFAVSLGQARLVPLVLLGINLVGFVAATYAAARLSMDLGRSVWWSALVFLNPGIIMGITVDTAEPLLIACCLLGLLLWLRGRRKAPLLLAVACWAGAIGLLVPIGLALYAITRRWRLPDDAAAAPPGCTSHFRLAALTAGPVLYAVWWVYLRAQFGSWPLSASTQVAVPPLGLIDALAASAPLAFGDFYQTQLGDALPPMLIALTGLLVVALIACRRLLNPYQAIAALMAIAILVFIGPALLEPRLFFRTIAAPIVFVTFAFLA